MSLDKDELNAIRIMLNGGKEAFIWRMVGSDIIMVSNVQVGPIPYYRLAFIIKPKKA